jgi:hypothetical protein
MSVLPRRLLSALLALVLAPALLAQAQPAHVYWADNWNGRYQRFADLDGDGTYLGAGEVSLHLGASVPGSSRARTLRLREEAGVVVSYWLDEVGDTVFRGVDVNGDGTVSGAGEVTTFRNSGLLDGGSVPTALALADDGAVWWTSAFLISQPVNGLVRLFDLNADGDAGDPGEMVVMVDGNAPHLIEHDLGTATTDAWSLHELGAAGDGVIAHHGPDGAVYRFEDLNGDGDVLDAGESILLLNATGERPDLPINPDFADGTLKNLQTPAGFPSGFRQVTSVMESGVRAFYFGTEVSPFNTSGKNLLGQGINFLIFRGVDGNGDGDVNDAGEVRTYYDGSSTDGSPDLLILRGFDVLDGGTVYAVGLQPFPALFPGPNGNAWIHRFEDLDGDGDAMDPFERQLEIFDLGVHGHDPVVFPLKPTFGDYMSDPWDVSVLRLTACTDMGGGTVGSAGAPKFSGTGTLAPGSPVTLGLVNAPPNAFMLSWISLGSTPASVLGGTLYTVPQFAEILWVAGPGGSLSVPTTWPNGLPSGFDVFMQFVVQDAGQVPGLLLSNCQKMTTP